MKDLNDFIKKLQSTSSRLQKEAILQTATEEQKRVLQFICNPYVVTGISKKKVQSRPVPVVGNRYSIKDVFTLMDYVREHNTGAYEVVDYALKVAYGTEFPELVLSIIKKDLALGVSSITLNKVYGEGFIPRFGVMLAQSYFSNPEVLVPQGTEFIITEKLDGVRCVLMFDEQNRPHFIARSGKEIEGLVDLAKEARWLPKDLVFDGELLKRPERSTTSNNLYRETMSIVGSDGEKTGVVFNVFDCLALKDFKAGRSDTPAYLRKLKAKFYISNGSLTWIKSVPVLYRGEDKEMIELWLRWAHQNRKEGIMINLSDAPYEIARSKGLLKVKTFNECEAIVRAVQEGGGRHQGRLGSLLVEIKDKEGNFHKVSVGSGFSDSQREQYFNQPKCVVGKVVEISYFEVTRNQADTSLSLRFPVWLDRIREDKTEEDMTPIV